MGLRSSVSGQPPVDVVVYGATGGVGRRICEALGGAGVSFAIAGRRRDTIEAMASELGVAGYAATLDDPAALEQIAGRAKCVVCAAAPLAESAEPLLEAALGAGAAYLDVGGEQAVLRAIHEQHESAARKAGILCVPGCGLDCAIGDLAAAWASAVLVARGGTGALANGALGGPLVRAQPAPRIGDAAPLDDVSVAYIFDDIALSAGQQRAAFARIGERPVAWCRDRWEAAPSASRKIDAGPELGGIRSAVPIAAGDVLTIPRHVSARMVTTYVSPTRRAPTALSLLSRALPLVPRAATALLAPTEVPDDELARTRFAIVASARRGSDVARVIVHGSNVRATTANIAAWFARTIARRGAGPLGVRAPAELVRPDLALRALADAAQLQLEPSF